MTEPRTLRQRVLRARRFLVELDAAVLTTFALSAEFFDEHVLPAVFGIDGDTGAARRQAVHEQLAQAPVTVAYDPVTRPQLTGRYRYVAQPVPLLGRFFHPKMIVLAGRDVEGDRWIHLGVGSANLTMSGWGMNVESWAETWIHTSRQDAARQLRDFLLWLQGATNLKYQDEQDAVAKVLDALADLPDGYRRRDDPDAPWSGTLDTHLYTSVTHPGGLADFLVRGRRRPKELNVWSPYWGDIAANLAAFAADDAAICPATRHDGRIGLTQEQLASLADGAIAWKNPNDDGGRFWHLKAIEVVRGDRSSTAFGSCNFTTSGLAGIAGNVEAMLVIEHDADDWPDHLPWEPDNRITSADPLAEQEVAEEEAPRHLPVAPVVAWDWRSSCWRWWIDADRSVADLVLHLPDGQRHDVVPATVVEHSGQEPRPGSAFRLTWRQGDEAQDFEGRILDLHLDLTTRQYGRALSATEIMDSWRGRPVSMGDGDRADGDGQTDSEVNDVEVEPAVTFEAFDLYDFHRSVRVLLRQLSELDGRPNQQRALVVTRPDSVVALARLALAAEGHEAVRYLVLRELDRVARTVHEAVPTDAMQWLDSATTQSRADVLGKLDDQEEGLDHKAVLAWFDDQLARLDEVPA